MFNRNRKKYTSRSVGRGESIDDTGFDPEINESSTFGWGVRGEEDPDVDRHHHRGYYDTKEEHVIEFENNHTFDSRNLPRR